MNKEALLCAQINFENLEKMVPQIVNHPIYILAKQQLDDGLKEDEEQHDTTRSP